MTVQSYLTVVLTTIIISAIVSILATIYVKKSEFMKIKLDVTKEQMLNSEQRIETFLNDNNIKDNQSIAEIAKILNVEQGGTKQDLQEQAHLEEIDGTDKKTVIFKTGLSEKEKLFAFAHELAHLLNGDSIPATRPSGGNKSQIEQLADYTAAALLMPIEEVNNYLIMNNYRKVSARKQATIVHKLCKKYNVTEVIALRRIKEIQVLKG